MKRRLLPLALSLLLAGGVYAQAPDIPPPQDVPYPGTIKLEVDATNLSQRIFRMKETIPVQAGPLTLLYPKWVPGGHSPRNPIDKIAGITFKANGKTLDWTRDPLDVNAFHLDVPSGVSTITAEFDYLTPTTPSQGRIVMTPDMLNLQTRTASRSTCASLTRPAGLRSPRCRKKAVAATPWTTRTCRWTFWWIRRCTPAAMRRTSTSPRPAARCR